MGAVALERFFLLVKQLQVGRAGIYPAPVSRSSWQKIDLLAVSTIFNETLIFSSWISKSLSALIAFSNAWALVLAFASDSVRCFLSS